MEPTDEYIASQVQAGDSNAFGLLIDRYENKMRRYGRRFLTQKNDLDDVVQDVFIKVYTHIQSYVPQKKFSSWIYRIAHNEFVNLIKKKKSIPFSFFDADVLLPHSTYEESADDATKAQEAKKMIDTCIADLDQKYSEPLILFYFEEMKYQEISDILEIPVSTVGVRIDRGKKQLRKIYEEKYGKY